MKKKLILKKIARTGSLQMPNCHNAREWQNNCGFFGQRKNSDFTDLRFFCK